MLKEKIRVALLVDEFFGGAETRFGGYGFLARRGICQYVPNDEIQIDVILGKNKVRNRTLFQIIKGLFIATATKVDDVVVYRVPRINLFCKKWLKKKNYDMYYSIELINASCKVLKNEPNHSKKLIFSIQDPRPQYEWDEINTVNLAKEPSYYNQDTYDYVHDLAIHGRIPIWNSHAHYLVEKAKDLYNLPELPKYIYLPNPVPIDYSYDVEKYKKKNMVVFLGRLADVKRGWIFCEIAKKCPQYDFYVLGAANGGKGENQKIFDKYKNLENLHLEGHVDGEEKQRFLKEAKVIIVSSIHEAVQTAQIEAMAYGVVPVSNLNPDGITEEYGIWVGDVYGDGFESVDKFVDAVNKIMNNDEFRIKKAENAIKYVRKDRDYKHWAEEVRREIKEVYENEKKSRQ